jgi:hypothetical protein
VIVAIRIAYDGHRQIKRIGNVIQDSTVAALVCLFCIPRFSRVTYLPGRHILVDVQAHVEVVVTQRATPPTHDNEKFVLSTILVEATSVGVEYSNILWDLWSPFLWIDENDFMLVSVGDEYRGHM